MTKKDTSTTSGAESLSQPLVAEEKPWEKSFCAFYWEINKTGLPINLTYTIGYIIWAVSILFSKMVDRLPPEEQEVFLDFITVMPNYFTTFFFLLLSPVLGVYPRLYQFRGELAIAEEEGKPQQEIDLIREKISHTNAIALSINTVSTMICCALYYNSEEILSAWHNEAVAAYAAAYLRPICAAMPAIFWRVAIEVNLFAAEQQIWTGLIDMTTCAAVIGLSAYISTDTTIPVPEIIRLIAWAIVGESWTTFLANLVYLLCHPELRQNRYWKLCGHSKEAREGTVAAIVPQSLSSGANMLMEVGVGISVSSVIPQIRLADGAALSFSMQLANLGNMLTGAISMGGGQVLGTLLGKMREAGEFHSTLKIVFASILANLTQILPLSILTWAWAQWLILAFSAFNPSTTNSSLQTPVTNDSTIPPYLTTSSGPITANDTRDDIEAINAIFAPITGAIEVLETFRYSMVFLARSNLAPVSALLFCVLFEGLGLGSGIGVAFELTDSKYVLLGWLVGLALADCFLLPLVLSLNTRAGGEQIMQREKGGPRYEMSVVLPGIFGCRKGNRSKAPSAVHPHRTTPTGSFLSSEKTSRRTQTYLREEANNNSAASTGNRAPAMSLTISSDED